MSRPPRPRRVIVPLSRRRRSLNPDKHALWSAIGILLVLGSIAVTWAITYASIRAQRVETQARAEVLLSNQATILAEQVERQLLAVDLALQFLARSWEADPAHFELEQRRTDSLVLSGISRDLIRVDENGIVRQASVPEAIGQNIATRDFVVYARRQPTPRGGVFIGAASLDPIMRQWHLNVAVWLHRPDGSFGGAIAADYRVSALVDVFKQAFVGTNGLVAVIGTRDGRIRASLGPTDAGPNADMSGTPMILATKGAPNGVWIGNSATDAVRRIHAFRQLPKRDLMLVVAMDQQDAMQPATLWQWQASRYAGGIVVLLLVMGWLVLHNADLARSRGQSQAADHATLAATNAQLQVAKAEADAKAEHLEATLAGMTDGIYMVDSQFCLVEWNARFPDLAGIPPELPRVGLPMEDILRAQAAAGLFGEGNVETEVARRMAALRTRQFGTTQRTRPDGRTIELRRKGLPDGGFVTLYSDITEHKRIEAALREARSNAEAANAAKTRFVAVVSHEIRTPLNALLNTIRLLDDSVLSSSQRDLLAMAARSGDALSSLINDILEMSRMEAGQLTLRASDFELRPMLAGALEIFGGQAAARGLTLRLAVEDDVPATIRADGGRLRQVLLNLLSNAVKFAHPGEVVLTVQHDFSAQATAGGLRIAVRDPGPVISATDRTRLFRPFSRLDRPDGDETLGTGLGLSICHHILALMGGQIGCQPWLHDGVEAGNEFWLTLPDSVIVMLPRMVPQATQIAEVPTSELPRRALPRTRILLVDDVHANRVVAATLLRRAGHSVDTVSNGADALEALRLEPYDIVFMDIFMQGMSGQETTQQIRMLPGLMSRVPVIALTANTAPEDEIIFLSAGMNGVVAKPVSLADLQTALVRHVWRGLPSSVTPILQRAPEAETKPRVLAMDRVAELRENLPPDVLATLVEACVTDLEERMQPFRRALASGVVFEIEEQAHTIAGVAAGYGLATLETKARALLAAARAGDTAALEAGFAETEAELTRGAEAWREILQKQAA